MDKKAHSNNQNCEKGSPASVREKQIEDREVLFLNSQVSKNEKERKYLLLMEIWGRESSDTLLIKVYILQLIWKATWHYLPKFKVLLPLTSKPISRNLSHKIIALAHKNTCTRLFATTLLMVEKNQGWSARSPSRNGLINRAHPLHGPFATIKI